MSGPEGAGMRAPIGVDHVSKSFGSVVALADVTFTAPAGAITGIVGPNGSGKTSLLNVLSGLMKPDSGRLLLDGDDVTGSSAAKLARRGVGRTFQTPRVFAELDMWEHVAVGLESAPAGRAEAAFAESLAGLRERWTGLDVTALPHGSQRLLEILRVVARVPHVLLLDEPAAGLSAAERNDVAELLTAIRDRIGSAIVLVEHDLSLVWRVADRIAVMDNGSIVESGTPDELKHKASVSALFVGTSDAQR